MRRLRSAAVSLTAAWLESAAMGSPGTEGENTWFHGSAWDPAGGRGVPRLLCGWNFPVLVPAKILRPGPASAGRFPDDFGDGLLGPGRKSQGKSQCGDCGNVHGFAENRCWFCKGKRKAAQIRQRPCPRNCPGFSAWNSAVPVPPGFPGAGIPGRVPRRLYGRRIPS